MSMLALLTRADLQVHSFLSYLIVVKKRFWAGCPKTNFIVEEMTENGADEPITEERISEDIADNAASALAGLEELAMLDNGALAKIEELEKQMFYRQFYFPGDRAVKRMPGLGTDTKDVKYDQIPGERDLFTRWDPRYLDDYIQQAQQNGFHRHFLFFDGSAVKTISYDEAYDRLHGCLNGTSVSKVGGCTEIEVYGILAGLRYMGKLDSFMSEFKSDLGLSKRQVEQMINLYGAEVVPTADKQLMKVIGQSSKDFISKDYGWQAEDQVYAFDIAQYAKEWYEMQDVYREYKNRIWEILKNTNALNLCTNRTSGIQVGDVNIQQTMDCAMRIEGVSHEMSAGKDDGVKDEKAPVSDEVKDDEEKVSEVKGDEEKVSEVKEEPSTATQAAPQSPAQEVAKVEEVKEEPTVVEEEDDSMKMIAIILIVVGVIVIGAAFFFMLRSDRGGTSKDFSD